MISTRGIPECRCLAIGEFPKGTMTELSHRCLRVMSESVRGGNAYSDKTVLPNKKYLAMSLGIMYNIQGHFLRHKKCPKKNAHSAIHRWCPESGFFRVVWEENRVEE